MVPFSVLLQNRSVFAEVCWAAERSEMASTAVSSLPLNSVDDDFPGDDGLSDDSFSSNDSDSGWQLCSDDEVASGDARVCCLFMFD
jgi:hypothetical protein